MISIGCDKAVNLDGGGSTAMVLKELGSQTGSRVINPEKNSSEKKSCVRYRNFNTSPATGVPKGIKIQRTRFNLSWRKCTIRCCRRLG